MENIYKELKQARQRLASLGAKDKKLQRTGSNLDANGERSLLARSVNSDSVERDLGNAARISLSGGPQMTGTVNLNLPGNDSHITGKVGGKRAQRASEELWANEGLGHKKQEAMLRPTNLACPMVRAKRPANADGATSFHFSHESITKTSTEQTSDRGTNTRKGSASDHVRYIERDEALARRDEERSFNFSGELYDLVANDPALARQLEIDADISGQDDDDHKLEVAVSETTLSVGGLATVYIEREEALAHNDNGIAVLFTNISDSASERREFWKLVEDHEPAPSPDKMFITIGDNQWFWKQVRNDEDCPEELRRVLGSASPAQEVEFCTGDNQKIRRLIARHGWRPRETRSLEETSLQKKEREEREVKHSRGARFTDGRGGRVQYRIIGELPYDVDLKARIRILEGFTAEFEKRRLPFIAVMHAPDHTNDDRNWHFHLVYHDRPARRFTGRHEDHSWPLPSNAAQQVKDRHKVLQQALDGEHRPHLGKWDFDVPFVYSRVSNRAKVTSYPFAQNKDREVTRRPFVPHLRKLLADLTNVELEKANIVRRLDPRKHSEMGIHKESDIHLGTTNSRLEALGIPTGPGSENEAKQWDYIQESINQIVSNQEKDIDLRLNTWTSGFSESDMSDADWKKLKIAIDRWEELRRAAIEHEAIACRLSEHIARMKSRAAHLEIMAKKHLDAIDAKKATSRQIAHTAQYRAKLNEARAHLAGLDIHLADEISQVAVSRALVTERNGLAKAFADIVDTMIEAGKQKRCEANNARARALSVKDAARGSDEAAAPLPAVAQPSHASITPTSAQDGPALDTAKLEKFIEEIIDSKRRLVEHLGFIIPEGANAEELKYIQSPGSRAIKTRLTALKASQDQLLNDLSTALAQNPGMLKPRKSVNVEDLSLAVHVRYSLSSPDRRLQAAFLQFAKDGALIALITEALAKKRHDAERQASKIIDMVAKHYLRPTVLLAEGTTTISFRREDQVEFDLPETTTILSETAQQRIRSLLDKHERSARRLLAYIEKLPSKVVSATPGKSVTLAAGVPDAIKQISLNLCRDPQVLLAMNDAVIRASIDKVGKSAPEAVEDRMAGIAQKKEPLFGEAFHAEMRALDEDSKARRKARKDAQRVAEDLQKGTEKVSQEETRKEGQNEGRERSSNEGAFGKNVIEFSTAPVQASELDEGPLYIDDKGNIRMRPLPDKPESEMAELMKPKVLGEDHQTAREAAAEAQRKIERDKQARPMDAFDGYDLHANIAGAKPKQPFRKLARGLNESIDLWMDNDRENNLDARLKAADGILRDPVAMAIIEEFEPKARARFETDFEAVKEKARQHSLIYQQSLGMGR